MENNIWYSMELLVTGILNVKPVVLMGLSKTLHWTFIVKEDRTCVRISLKQPQMAWGISAGKRTF